MRTRMLLAVLVLAGAGGATRADDKPLDRAELDKRIVAAVYESAVLGTDLFNPPKSNYEGCYRLYEGTLLAVYPLLDHRPKLQAQVRERLVAARKLKPADAAFELRTALDEIQKDIAPSKEKPKTTTLWERLGGEVGVRKVVKSVILDAVDSPKVNFFRGKKIDPKDVNKTLQHLEDKVTEWVSSKTGGTIRYSGKSMAEVHKGMMITDAEFDAFKAIIIDKLKKAKVSDADIATIEKAVEATRADIVEKKK